VHLSYECSTHASFDQHLHCTGGTLSPDELDDPEVLRECGTLYGNLHALGAGTWFDGDALRSEGMLLLPHSHADNGSGVGGSGGGSASADGASGNGDGGVCGSAAASNDNSDDWASCTWVLPWLERAVPPARRAELEADGVDWSEVDCEIAGLKDSTLLPAGPRGVLASTVTVHGDGWWGNLVRDANGRLHVIDFDMTAPGPAGSELAFQVLCLFRCAFAADPSSVASRACQVAFAEGYLRARWEPAGGAPPTSDEVDELLLAAHLWGYAGMLKMGLLCAVLGGRDGQPEKRNLQQTRGRVLLHPGFLACARGVARRALEGAGGGRHAAETRAAVLERGLFFVTVDEWEDPRPHTVKSISLSSLQENVKPL
jgi:hypothetical protein